MVASDSSRSTSTPVTVRRPIRGSATSRCSSVASSSRMRSPTRRARASLVIRNASLGRHLFGGVALDHVSDLEIGEALQSDAALEALADLADVFLLVSERGDGPVEDHVLAAQQPRCGVAPDLALADVAAGDVADLGEAGGRPHFGLADNHLARLGREHAFERLLDILGQAVDDVVQAGVEPL